MKKIQVTNVKVDVPAQIILPNTYFAIKLVKAQLAMDRLETVLHECRQHIKNKELLKELEPTKELVDEIAPFLCELVDALEGENDSSKD